MRTFYAIPFDQETKTRIKSFQESLFPYVKKGNFTNIDNFHLTMKFIGNIEDCEVDKHIQKLELYKNDAKPFYFHMKKLGFFEKKNQYILYYDIERNSYLYRANRKLQRIIDPNDIEKFKPHVTLARQARLGDLMDIERMIELVKPMTTKVMVNKIALMESKREDGELVYKPIHTIEF